MVIGSFVVLFVILVLFLFDIFRLVVHLIILIRRILIHARSL